MSDKSESSVKADISASVNADISDVSNNVLTNLCIPASKQLGKSLGNIAGLLHTTTLPIKLFNQYAKKNYEKLEEKLKDIPEENIREVEPEIGIPIMEKIAYTSNDNLSELYTSLLANASQKDKIHLVHPGFVNKINSMAPDEAKILEFFRKKNNIPYIMFRAENENNDGLNISNNLTTLENEINIDANTFQVHLENLVSLSLIEDLQGRFLSQEGTYDSLENVYPQFKKSVEENQYGSYNKLKVVKSYYRLSKVGETFLDACII